MDVDHCTACRVELTPMKRQGNPKKWCSASCAIWARRNPGKTRQDPTCRGCSEPFHPIGNDKWCATCRNSTPPCEWCGQSMHWRLSNNGLPARFCPEGTCASSATAARLHPETACSEPGCVKRSRTRGMCKTHYNKANGYYIGDLSRDPDRERARLRLKTHRRKDWLRLTDVTPEYEMALRAKAKKCPLCSVKLTDRPYEPCSKELDHIIPKGVGGTHTIGNVRIVCRACNLARPKDGSDYTGPVTLWAQEVA